MFFLLLFVGCATADAGDDFSNNLFSDLAPLLALFGERVAMQFMSQSMGWADHVILAMAPVGIITIIVSAIRVGGPSWLKAIIGRARENLAVAEVDLMSSTSKEVCELWNGQEVVRCMGSAPVTEFICLLPELPEGAKSYAQMEIETVDLKESLRRRDLMPFNKSFRQSVKRKLHPQWKGQDTEEGHPPSDPPKSKVTIVRNTTADAPNISLNSHNQYGRGELRVVAVIATVLQFGVLAFCGFATYHPTLKFQKDDSAIQDYAFPCTATGTLTLIVGLLICSHVVESSTTEERYKPRSGLRARMVWLQKTQTVSDQQFGSYAIFAADDRALITTSHRALKDKEANHAIDGPCKGGNSAKTPSEVPEGKARKDFHKFLSHYGIEAVMGTAVSLCGFIVQFIGLRRMHWSASIAQLLAVLIMMALRALVRRGLAKPPECIKLTSGFELDWFATTLGDIDNAPWLATPPPGTDNQTRKPFRKWTVITGEIAQKHDDKAPTGPVLESNSSVPGANGSVSVQYANHLSSADKVMKLRRNLGRLADWRGPASEEAIAVARAIEITMDTLFGTSPKDSPFFWSICARFGGLDKPFKFQVKRQGIKKWKAYSDEIEATLSLWLYSVDDLEDKDPQTPSVQPRNNEDGDDAWLRAKGSSMKRSLRLLGVRTNLLSQSLEWWMPDEAPSILHAGKDKEILTGVEGHRVVGCGVHHLSDDNTPSPEPGDTETSINATPKPVDAAMSNAENFSAGIDGDVRKSLLATDSYNPLKLLYAQDIFSAFVWAAANQLSDPMTGAAEIRPIDDTSGTDSWQSFKLRNGQLSKMVQDIQTTGLGNAADIYLSVIPPLSILHKLPEAESIIRLARDRARRPEQRGQLLEASFIYEWLFQTAAILQPESPVCVRATAVLMEHLRQLTLNFELKTHENDEEDLNLLVNQISYIEEQVRVIIRDSGNNAIFEVISNLMEMYEAQGRGWKCGLTQEDRPERNVKLDVEDEEDFDNNPIFTGLRNIPSLGFTKLHRLAASNPNSTWGRRKFDDALKSLLSSVDMNCRDVMDWSPLHYAAFMGSGRVLRTALDNTARDLIGWTPLHYACLRGDERILLTLIRQGAEVNAQGRDGKTPLHCAAIGGHLDLVRLLVEAGAVIDVSDAFGTTPLLWAVRKGYESVVDYLWPEASHKLRDYKGRTALHLAVAAGKKEMVVKLLGQDPPADMEAKDRNGQAPLHYAVERGWDDIVRLLVENDVNKNIPDRTGETPLQYAARRGQEAMVRILVDAGADMEARGNIGWTPLYLAIADDQEGIARLLIDVGADIEARDDRGRTPLYAAVASGHEGIARLLIDVGADKEVRDEDGSTPLDIAANQGREDIVRLLIDAGVDKEVQAGEA